MEGKMYRTEDKQQLAFKDFYLPFGGKLNPTNRWVQLAQLIPWEDLEEEYAAGFAIESGQGAPAIPFRTALGALIIKEKLGITDEETVMQIQETPYLQYLVGMQGYRDEAPFDPSMMTHFRKRISFEMISKVNEKIIAHLIDATCVPGDIRYPSLCHSAESAKGFFDGHQKAKSKYELQLGYLRRNLRRGVGLKSLSRQQYRNLLVTSEVFRQPNSISQPHIRPDPG
jgi:hypothetical protein